MTCEQAKSELMQIYMSLSEEKKKALDVAFKAMEQAQNCDQCEVGNPCLYCEHEFKAQADGECDFTCKYYASGVCLREDDHDGCKDCKYETYPEYYYPCCNCKQNYMDEWQKKPHWNHGVCDNCGYDWGKDAPIASVPNFCPNCGSPMEIER